MTYSMIGRCPDTGSFGGVIGTSALAVGNRCLKVVHQRGAFLSQHRTDSRLAEMGIDLLAQGDSAPDAIDRVAASQDTIDWRQLAALDQHGRTAVFHGRMMYSIYNGTEGRDCVAIGNILATPDVTDAMVAAFEAADGEPLAERLLRGLEAGREAGGEIVEPVRSAALLVSGGDGVTQFDLRVDRSEEAVQALRDLFVAYGQQHNFLRSVALTPDDVPVSRGLFQASITRIRELGLEDSFPTEARQSEWKLRD